MNAVLRRTLCLLFLVPMLSASPALSEKETLYDDLTDACRAVRAAVYARQTNIRFSLTNAAVNGRSTAAIRDILTDVLEGCIDYTITFDQQADRLGVTIRCTLRPALNILHAWETGDRSSLTDDEQAVMDIALSIVEEGRQSAQNDLEVERRMYDEICRRVHYYRSENPPKFGSPEYIRLHTSIGALLDGQTQCLGYSEVFYLLGRLAGLNVQMQYGFSGGSGKHAWNTICIDEKDYFVDVCWSDVDSDIFQPTAHDYRYFNFGKEHLPKGRHAHPEAAIAEITPETDWALTAFGAAGGGALCHTLESALDYAIAQHSAGQPYAHIFIPDQALSLSAVNDAMREHVKAEGIATTWGRMTYDFAGGTYIVFRWVLE